ncbi:hypothetical protein NL676_009067 [Syzygium grande]|nr:hypothetical protein NL676_009067 [Syzygium grande]
MTSSVAQPLPTLLHSIPMKSYITIYARSVTAMIRRAPAVITINTAAPLPRPVHRAGPPAAILTVNLNLSLNHSLFRLYSRSSLFCRLICALATHDELLLRWSSPQACTFEPGSLASPAIPS